MFLFLESNVYILVQRSVVGFFWPLVSWSNKLRYPYLKTFIVSFMNWRFSQYPNCTCFWRQNFDIKYYFNMRPRSLLNSPIYGMAPSSLANLGQIFHWIFQLPRVSRNFDGFTSDQLVGTKTIRACHPASSPPQRIGETSIHSGFE